jgi:hypothetical protein
MHTLPQHIDNNKYVRKYKNMSSGGTKTQLAQN